MDPIKPLTESQWQRLPGKAKWDCVVALRGPDWEHSDSLKYHTASVIRWKLSGIMRVGGMINEKFPYILIPNSKGFQWHISKWPGFALGHFLTHINEAASYLRIPVIHLGVPAWEALMSQPHSGELPNAAKLEVDKYLASFAKEGFAKEVGDSNDD